VPGMPAAPPVLAHSPLEPQLQKSGATMVARHGWWVAAHYGSPAGELALCETAVGLADRSDLGKLELRGERSALEQLVGQLSGGRVDPCDALLAQGAWWCAVSRTHVLALCDAGETQRLTAAAQAAVRWTPGATAADVTAAYAAIGLLGPRTADVLNEISDSEPPLGEVDSPAFDVLRLAAVPAMLLRASAGRAIALTEAGRGSVLWIEVERAGREAGIGHVGMDAVTHHSPLAR
jgi:glycine cleavage system aminomethyltransferase T